MAFIKIENLKISKERMDADTALRAIGRIMVESKSVKPEYVENMIASYKEFGPYFVIAPGVAIAHAKPDESVIRDDIALMICHHPVVFNSHNDPVSMLFGLCATGSHQHMEVLMQVANLLSDTEAQKQIMHVSNEQELFELLNSLSDKT
ncbi:MAG: PTS sugar transporter subunit IIA [Erysipelotrichaceae bacterium]|nr:PTS sugar transporter subunit IIA [Erysipelotrichaceae bacterium]MDP3304694.1 PTS sugar transporter subunit IIA [Erysipelotrichaceae bacterium]